MARTGSREGNGVVRTALSTPVVVSLMLILVFLFQVIYLGPWMLGAKEGSLSRLVTSVTDQWIQGVDVSGFAPPPGSRIAFIPARENWSINVNGSTGEVVELTPILSAASVPAWGIYENSTRKHDLLAALAVAPAPEAGTRTKITHQYVYLGKRYLGFARSAERTVTIAGSGRIEKAWFLGEVPVPSSYQVPLILNLVLLAFSLPFAISTFVMRARGSGGLGRSFG